MWLGGTHNRSEWFQNRTFLSGEKLTSDGQFVPHAMLRKCSILLRINAHSLLDPNTLQRRAIRGQHFNASWP
jgi:hypothetical protein